MIKIKRKILIFSSSPAFGGVEKALVNYCKNMDKSKYEITVLTWNYCDKIKSNLRAEINYKYLFNNNEPRGFWRIIRYLPAFLLHRIFIKEHYDIEIAFQEGNSHKIISGARKTTKKICWFHTNSDNYDIDFKLYKTRKEVNKIINKFDKICFVSNYNKEWNNIRYNFQKDKEIVIYNPIDIEEIKLKSQEEFNEVINKQILNLIVISRLSPEKKIDELIAMLIKLKREYNYNFFMRIIGEGSEYQKLNKMIDDNKANNYIKLLGFRDNPYVLLKESDLLICNSGKIESFSLAVAEAMVLNIPILSCSGGAPEELINEYANGILVKSNKELYEQLKNLIEKPEILKNMKNEYVNNEFKFDNKIIQSIVDNLLDTI